MRIRTLALAVAMIAAAAPAIAAPLLLDERALEPRLETRVATRFDSARGGWVSKEGVPDDGATTLALRLAGRAEDDPWRLRAKVALEWTWSLHDTLGGGFWARGGPGASTPGRDQLEKRTDLNARRLENLIDAWLALGDTLQRRRAARVVGYMDRVLVDGRGGFVTAQVGDRELQPAANGLALHAWLRWLALADDARMRGFVHRSLDRVYATGRDTSYGLTRRGTFGELLVPPQLIDQVEMGRACLLSAHLTGRAIDLERARWLADRLLRWYEDADKGGFMSQVFPDKSGRIRKAPRRSDENARAALFLAELASVSGEAVYRDAARRTVAAFGRELETTPTAADWALAARAVWKPELPGRPLTAPAPPAATPKAKGKARR
jgi:uncharacterized protein